MEKNEKKVSKMTTKKESKEKKMKKEVVSTSTEKNKKTNTLKKEIKKVDSNDKEQKKIKKEVENKKINEEKNTLSTLKDNEIEENQFNRKTMTDIFLEADQMEIVKERNKKREFHTIEVIVLVLLTCVISLIVGSAIGSKFSKKNSANGNLLHIDANLQSFIEEYNYLIENYYGEIDTKELLNEAFKSIVNSLDDRYTGTIDESTSNNFDIELEGKYEGLGIEIINDENKNILIYSIIPNSPAAKADIVIGDKLLIVNDISVVGMTTTEFINNIVKGSGATTFSIVLERNGEQKNVEIQKERITLQSVTSKTYEDNGKMIGYLNVSIFAANTYSQFSAELNNLESMGIDSLIIDLRDNSGGHLTAVRDMIGLFLDSSHIIYQTQDNKNKIVKTYSNGGVTKEYPIVIIANSTSASASEVMIGALMDEYGAVLVGNKTFGKGTVQELHELSNGDEYKFTTKKWLTPKGVWVHQKGIEPTIEVTLSRDYYSNPIEENDNQLKTALDYLKGLK